MPWSSPTGRLPLCLALAGAALLAAPAPLLAGCGPDPATTPADVSAPITSVDTLADRMLARYEGTLGEVEGMTVYADGATATYTPNVDSLVLNPFVLQIQPASDGPGEAQAAQLLYSHVPNVPRLARGLRSAELSGPIDYEGSRVYVFATDDPTTILGDGAAPADRRGTVDFRVYVDAETFDVREIYQGVSDTSFARPYVNRLVYDDFRTVDGVTLPFRVRQIETGADALMTPESKTVARGQLELQRRVAANQPSGPDRDAALAEVDRQLRIVNEGLAEATLTVDSVRVAGAGGAP